jgi:phospholipase/carboxylesterase
MAITTELSHLHRFVPATEPARPPLLLLHGTGGDENDLLPLGGAIASGSALLSPRGKVLEGGMPRFFRRLADFVADARDAYGLSAPIAVGFSNGANIATAVLQLRPEALAGAALLRAMVPLADPPAADLAGKPVLILSGASDPIVPAENAARLAGVLRAGGAVVDHRTLPVGHGLSQSDVAIAKAWLDQR